MSANLVTEYSQVLRIPEEKMGKFLEDVLEGLVHDYRNHHNFETLDQARHFIKLQLNLQTSKEGGEYGRL